MNQDINQNTYTTKLKELPQEIQSVIENKDWGMTLHRISEKYKLHIDQVAAIEMNMKYLMVGLLDVDMFFDELSNLELEPNIFEALLDDIEIQVMQVLKKKIMDQTGITEDVAAETSSPLRDSILAEIEKEEPVVPQSNIIMPKFVPTQAPVQTQTENKPFVTSTETAMVVDEPKLASGEVVTGIQSNPVASGLTGPTVMVTTPNPTPAPITKSSAPDPYREPIE